MTLRVSDARSAGKTVIGCGNQESAALRVPCLLVAILIAASDACAEPAYPAKPVRFIVPSAAGSGTDILARILGRKLGEPWGQSVPGYESTVWHGVLVVAGTPAQLVKKLHQEIAIDVVKSSEVREQIAAQWVEPLGTTPGDFAKLLKADLERSCKIVQDAGIRAE